MLKILLVILVLGFLFKTYSKVIIKFLMNILAKRLMKLQKEQARNFQQQSNFQQPQQNTTAGQFEKTIKVDEDMTIFIPKKKK
ncbi:hypothetical protein MY04_0961 [Flammeovirga sp. MY04]|uniref:hypothetical protein n=1 Tax=Flammeovirga sp. MY04 TaxID=1191459 RepID=UPI0008246FBE|nr:hypothetical protein [Flammeovirga sp. MY04]ANQ48343.2 hypothetical protein MY04_0961 [Flammeovirga sp. MY04]